VFDPVKTGTRIRELRMRKKLSQQELANCLKVKRESIAKWESGDRELKATPLVDIADFFQVSTDYLLGIVDYRSRNADIQGICEETGLSSEAVEALRDMNTGAAEDWEYSAPYQKSQKEGAYQLINALLDRDELLEDLLLLAKQIEDVATADQHLCADSLEKNAQNKESGLTLSPHEMKEYREYLVIEQARRLAFRAMDKLVVPKSAGNTVDIRGLEVFYNIKANGGEL